jgi:PAN domain
MQNMRASIFVLALAMLTGAHFPTEGSTAEIFAARTDRDQVQSTSSSSYAPSNPPRCDIRFTGMIDAGDAEQFKRIVESLVQDHRGVPIYVCLDSGGGNVEESLRIARYIRWIGDSPDRNVEFFSGFDTAIVTVVGDRARCASACAIIFMAGSALTSPARFLHPRGQLIFHSSFIADESLRALTVQNIKPNELEELYSLGLQDFREIIKTFDSVSTPRGNLLPPWVRPSLFLEAFSQGPEELMCIDNIDQVGRWGIELFGFAPPKEITKPMVRNACQNTFYWRQDSSARVPRDPFSEEPPVFWTPLDETIGGRSAWSTGFDSRAKLISKYNYAQCVVEITGDIQAQIFYADSSDRRVSDIARIPTAAFFAPDTLLPEIADTEALTKTPGPIAHMVFPRPSEFREYPDRMMSGCNLRRLSDTDASSCQTACSKLEGCVAYSFNKVFHTCELKHDLNPLRKDPLWTSGVPTTIDPDKVLFSKREEVMGRPLPEPRGTFIGRDLVGDKKSESHVPSRRECEDKCDADLECQGYSFFLDPSYSGAGRCALFAHITNVVSGFADSAVKRQP